MMRVLHIIPSLEIGGAQKLLADLICIQSRNDDVRLLVFKNVHNHLSEKIQSAGVEIISLDVDNVYNPLIIFKLRKYLREYEVVHVHLFPALYWAAISSYRLSSRMIFTEHSTSNIRRTKKILRPIERFIYSCYDEIVSISPQVQDALKEWLGDNNSYSIVNNGIDLSSFSRITKLIEPSKSIIMVSRFVPAKDQETVIRAMQYIHKDVTLKFVGDGPLLSSHIKLTASLGLDDRVMFLGARSDIPELIAGSMIGIQSSHWEGFGLTALEVMACERPIIASSVNGLKQVVEGAGALFEEGDYLALADIVNRLMDNENAYQDAVNRCKERVLQYDVQSTAEGYRRIYYA